MNTKTLINSLLIFYFSSANLSLAKPAPASLPRWGVVYGADADIELARYEINNAKDENIDSKNGPPFFRKDPVLFYRDGWYRSVIVFETKAEAQKAERTIQKRLRPKSYFIDIKEWCPNMVPAIQKSKKEGYPYYQC